MTKADTVQKITEKTGIEKEAVEKILESFFVTIKDSMTGGENIYFRGFGSFTNKKRAQKTARNISKNTSMTVPAQIIPHFKPSEEFVKLVKEAGLTKV
ncbi:HU family DNA-binding protein [Dyadobacter subterraneus]|uniref:Integration host factor subunit beta n=1 Tax=Dyadobacter subterraneus TaxID=2773304 RepID=A0ABR9W9I8_9BACT|nr:HU family DNA-binding protein [Dyadobacter subterraneus]MBE9462078.1 integration host factor subunit beta [Dyadobacter subterraneus]